MRVTCALRFDGILKSQVFSFVSSGQARSQVLGCRGGKTCLGGNIFVFIICLKENFLCTIKFWEKQKIVVEHSPRGFLPGAVLS